MSRRRWIADKIEGDRALLLGANAAHLARVLRAKVGQEFEIASPESVRLGRVISVDDASVEFELGGEVKPLQIRRITLLLAIFKFDRMEWAIEKATELGVEEIVPVIARRSDAHLLKAAAARVERWRRLVREAAQQSRRSTPAEVVDPQKLETALASADGLRIVLAETESENTLRSRLQQASAESGVTLAIGPEGGWSSEELGAFTQNGWLPATLGPTILRTETAAIAAIAITAHALLDGAAGEEGPEESD